MLDSFSLNKSRYYRLLKNIISSPETLPWPRIAGPLAAAEDALARLDERLARSPIRTGFLERTHFTDACACLWLAGDLVHLEDLVLHDAGMDVRAPTHELTRAHTVLRARRRIASAAPGWALTVSGLDALRGRAGAEAGPKGQGPVGQGAPASPQSVNRVARSDPDGAHAAADDSGLDSLFAAIDAAIASTQRTLAGHLPAPPGQRRRDPLVHDPDWNEEARLAQWRSTLAQTRDLPPALAAAIAAAAWDEIDPLQNTPWLGRLLCAALLRARDKTQAHLACLFTGMRALPQDRRRRGREAGGHALLLHLDAITAAAQAGLRDHDRWRTAHTLLMRKLEGRRATSHLPALIDLVLSRPIISTGMAAADLKISQRAAQNLIADLGLREFTGRGRYRAWGIV